MVSPVRPEMTGLIGAISAPVRGISHLLKLGGVSAANAAIRKPSTYLHPTENTTRTWNRTQISQDTFA
ncbi:WSSV097 [White spot syndrome virus]|uniref:WSSV097 n=1 Tax=White spot syndrome virus TaxID=342409 RepID=A0A2I6SBL5_9VIRU|nr:WSSV097 [White spot syndrome virus]